MTLLSLRAGKLAVALAPSSGGSVVRFAVEDPAGAIDVLRLTDPAGIAAGWGSGGAAYPLVPYSNRIAAGRLCVDGGTIQLKPNWPGMRNPMHGDGWAHPWTVVRSDTRSAELLYEHDGKAGWPFRYRARQSFRLDEHSLTANISVENREDRALPAGIGLHPFFARDPDTELAFHTARVWLADAETLPTIRVAVPPQWDFRTPRRVDEATADNCFDGWDGRATIVWPRHGLRLDLEASDRLRHVVLYIPPGKDYFALEPVSHANNAFALAARGVEDVGTVSVAAGEVLAGEIVFRLSSQ
jgi:aldose 1-epimerase